MKVVVFKPSRGTPPALADIVLQQDAFVGNIKILRRGQVETPASVLPEGPLEPLDEEFCSLGQSLDYYERLAAFPEELRRFLLEFFRDALAYPLRAETFEQEKGWRVSVTRDLDIDSYVPLGRFIEAGHS